MKLKAGASLDGVSWRLFAAAIVVERCFNARGYECWITSGSDPAHARLPNTKHARGEALDFRTRHVPDNDREPLAEEVQKVLGPGFDVVLVNKHHTKPDHLHVEYDAD